MFNQIKFVFQQALQVPLQPLRNHVTLEQCILYLQQHASEYMYRQKKKQLSTPFPEALQNVAYTYLLLQAFGQVQHVFGQ